MLQNPLTGTKTVPFLNVAEFLLFPPELCCRVAVSP